MSYAALNNNPLHFNNWWLRVTLYFVSILNSIIRAQKEYSLVRGIKSNIFKRLVQIHKRALEFKKEASNLDKPSARNKHDFYKSLLVNYRSLYSILEKSEAMASGKEIKLSERTLSVFYDAEFIVRIKAFEDNNHNDDAELEEFASILSLSSIPEHQ